MSALLSSVIAILALVRLSGVEAHNSITGIRNAPFISFDSAQDDKRDAKSDISDQEISDIFAYGQTKHGADSALRFRLSQYAEKEQ